MANVASVLKEEITRLARKEIKTETESLKKASAQYRSEIAALKRRVTDLEKQLSRLLKTAGQGGVAKPAPGSESKIRFTVKGFKSLRQKLGLTAGEIGILLDVPASTIYNWEGESSKPKAPQMERLAKLRTIGKREVKKLLESIAPQN